MRKVYKTPLRMVDDQQIDVPEGATPLHVGKDPYDNLCIWYQVDTEAPLCKKAVYIVGTGIPMPSQTDIDHVGSFLDGIFMWHVFISK